jgi:hypothetical protein
MATSKPSKFPSVPYGSISWLVNRRHVSETPEEIASFIEKRLRRMTLNGLARKTPRAFSESEIAEGRRYAKAVHADNCKLYNFVMGGVL